MAIHPEKFRLDVALETRGLVQSRARGRDAVNRGTVTVNGVVATKPHQMVAATDVLAVADPAGHYVSRSAVKLVAGLDAGAIDVTGAICLDLGASTGGFTQVLAERGAKKIYAVDVGHEQLHERVRALPAVVVMEGVNAKGLTRDDIAEPIDIVVCDISFVSVIKVIGPPLQLARIGAVAVILIKPQFEVGRENIGKGGIVIVPGATEAAVSDVIAFMANEGWMPMGELPSPISGGDGNKEVVALFRRTG